MGRHKKPIEQHKLEGTYRDCIHGKNAEPVIAGYLEVPADFLPPGTITDGFVKDHYQRHVRLLANLHILTVSDIPEINMMYETLQEYRRIYEKLQEEEIGSKEYESLSYLLLKYGKRFSDHAVRYCISPAARNKLTLESLQIKKEADNQKSMTAKLIGRKRA
jgi:phage terminase small subunit